MIKFDILIVILCHLMFKIAAETSFRHIVSTEQKDSRPAQNVWMENIIPSDEVQDVDLNILNYNILGIKETLHQQTQLIQFLITSQDQLVKDNSKWVKRYKSTKKLLRKLNRSCMCNSDSLENMNKNVDIDTKTKRFDFWKPKLHKPEVHNYKSKVYSHKRKSHNNKIRRWEKEDRMLEELIKGIPFNKPTKSFDPKFREIVSPDENLSTEADEHLLEVLPYNRKAKPRGVNSSVHRQSKLNKSKRRKGHRNEDKQKMKGPKDYDLTVDLTTGETIGNRSSFTFLLSESKLFSSDIPCRQQGVLKVSFPERRANEDQETLMIDMWFDTPTGWVFNIGDSKSNDGKSGDKNHQENDCEAEGFGTSFNIYGSDKFRHSLDKFLYKGDNSIRHNMTLLVTDEAISWKLESGDFQNLNNSVLFALKGQPDSQGTSNYDIYIGMNRVIAGNYRSGTGLCKIAFKWL